MVRMPVGSAGLTGVRVWARRTAGPLEQLTERPKPSMMPGSGDFEDGSCPESERSCSNLGPPPGELGGNEPGLLMQSEV